MTQLHLTPFDVAAILVVLVAAVGFANERLVKLPPSIAMTAGGAAVSVVIVLIDQYFPSAHAALIVRNFVSTIDLKTTLLDGMLAFLLFAGGLQVDWGEMHRGRWPILALSTVGVLLSTAIVGGGFWLMAKAFALPLPLIWCLVFGALISPTDPVAVIAILCRTSCPETLKATVAGESLFNDGIGVVVFSILLAAALGGDGLSDQEFVQAFAVEALGGVFLGFAVGWLGFAAMNSIDDYTVELIITLAMVMGGYALAQSIGVSGPVAMAVAGLLIGNAGVAYAMSDSVRDHVLKFWTLVDELLNALLFLLIGLELIAINPTGQQALLGAAAIPLVLFARWVSVLLPLKTLRALLGRATIPTLVWGGLRGGICIALALSLPDGPARAVILTVTYVVVLFSVVVQGGTIGHVVRRLSDEPPCESADTAATCEVALGGASHGNE